MSEDWREDWRYWKEHNEQKSAIIDYYARETRRLIAENEHLEALAINYLRDLTAMLASEDAKP